VSARCGTCKRNGRVFHQHTDDFAPARAQQGVADRGPDILLHADQTMKLARPTGFEPVAPGLGNLCSILLSYGRLHVTNYTVASAFAIGWT
jgi:hypothetical protein